MPVDTVVHLDINWRMRQCRSSTPIDRTQITASNSHRLNERNEVSDRNRETGGSKQFDQTQNSLVVHCRHFVGVVAESTSASIP